MDNQVIGLVANPTKATAADLTMQLAAQFRDAGGRLLMEEATATAAGLSGGLPLAAVAAEATVLVVLGGDGTILHTARQLGAAVKPLAAVNVGRLGFLTTATAAETDSFVQALIHGRYRISARQTIEAVFTDAEGRRHCQTGLNEAVISRGAAARTIRLDAVVDGVFVNRWSGDGLIVSSPTGSTAYCLSAGGPIIHPEAGVFCLTPICPHAIANRSVVISDSAVIELTASGASEELLLSIDGGAPWPLDLNGTVLLRRGAWTVPLVALPETTFYGVLRHKLQWNGGGV
jgi:NAD+ kinase